MPIKQLGPAIRKVLTKKFPNLGFELIKALENFILILEDKKHLYPDRGLGLGMGNNLWTLIQCVMFEILCSKVTFKMDALFGNDDSVIFIFGEGAELDKNVSTLIEEDLHLCEQLYIEQNQKKLFVSSNMVFYEEYTLSKFQSKECRADMNLGSLRTCSNIFEAKILTNSLISNLGYVPESLGELIRYFGYEFDPIESKLDFRLGGWYNRTHKGLSLVLREAYDSDFDNDTMYALAKASSIPWTFNPDPQYDLDETDRPLTAGRIDLIRRPPKGIKSAFLFMTRKELIKFFFS